MKKTRYYLAALVIMVLAVMNIAIWQKEQIVKNGELVYVKLAPLDPRSLMQGDYMQLGYAINEQLPKYNKQTALASKVVITTDAQQVAKFVRMDDGSALADNEKTLNIRRSRFSATIQPSSFFFQEGHAQFYQNAAYGIFVFDKHNPGSYVLNGLADEQLQRISPPKSTTR